MNLAIVHDFLNQYGGAERCLEIFHELFPQAPIYTLIHKKEYFPHADVRTSFIQKLPFAKKSHYQYLPLYPRAIERFDLSEFDVVLSNSAAFAKNVNKPKKSMHICFCCTPMRFVYTMPETYLQRIHPAIRPFVRLMLARLKQWDLKQTKNVDHFVAISHAVKERIKTHYGRDATVIYPPVDVDFFSPKDKAEDFYLIVSRLQIQKRVDLAVVAFNKLGKPLKIIGTGPELKRLKAMAKPNIEFLGGISDKEVRDQYRRCRAFLYPQEEDFGITAVEAQSCGKPVIGYAKGGLLETVIEGKTGHFFSQQTSEALAKAVIEFEQMRFDQDACRQNALRFDKKIFREKIKTFINQRYHEFTHVG
jgi:glycosyltransferase involved in cell wall biosynthesis